MGKKAQQSRIAKIEAEHVKNMDEWEKNIISNQVLELLRALVRYSSNGNNGFRPKE